MTVVVRRPCFYIHSYQRQTDEVRSLVDRRLVKARSGDKKEKVSSSLEKDLLPDDP